MYEELLEGIGLTRGESKVYLTLLKVGETTTGKIIDESGLSSGKIYEILERLIKKGLVAYIVKEKTKYFSATTPKKILEYVDLRKKELEERREKVSDILPSLVNLQKKEEYSAVIYKGIQGFKTAIYEALDGLSKGDEWVAFGVGLKSSEQVGNIWNHFNKELTRKKIPTKMIVTTEYPLEGLKIPKLMQVRIIPNEATAPMSISSDVVMIYNWKELSVIKITNKDIADSFRKFFYNLWKISKR